MEQASDPIDVVVSFDTTGSMSSVLAQVRRKVKQTVERLMGELPDIRIGIIVHGDYCDARSTYVTRHLDLTQDTASIRTLLSILRVQVGVTLPNAMNWCFTRRRSFPGARRRSASW